VALYRRTEPQSCAIRNVGASVASTWMSRGAQQLCTASRNVVLLYHQRGQDAMAAGSARTAIEDLGCP